MVQVTCRDCEITSTVETVPEACPVCSGHRFVYLSIQTLDELIDDLKPKIKLNPWRPRD